MATDLAKFAKSEKVRYFLISFTDLFGVQRSKLVPAQAIGDMQKTGAGFAGFASHLDMTPAHPDMFAVPDPESVIQLPWKPEVAWVAGDLMMADQPVGHAPRVVLKNVLQSAEAAGLRQKTGVECEYFIIQPDGSDIADTSDRQAKPCYDQQALMRRYELVSEICDHMIALGWGPYQNDHEDANGQFEMNWDYSDALVTADRHCFFKFMVKSVAEAHGLRATFMPKPFANLTGNGCHAHVSVWDKAGKKNLFHDKKEELGISALGYNYLGGLIKRATALTAITNPTINSYKRINAPRTLSGASWSPNTVTWSGNNRTHMVRVPDPGRIEVRLADGAANPYLLQAGLLAAGLDGIANKTDPGKRLDIDMYADGHKVRGAPRLPLNLLDALRLFAKDKVLRAGLGDELVDAYAKLKHAEWSEFTSHLTGWERERTLDC
ncbi:MAG: type III glutamate--ammonia ligase [Pseudomonadota bacterium]